MENRKDADPAGRSIRRGGTDAFARESMHAINSPLGAVLMSAELADLYLRMNRVPDARSAIAKLVSAAERCARILRDYFEAAATFEPNRSEEHSVESLIASLHRVSDSLPTFVCTSGGDLPLWLDLSLARMALRCMLINAADHGATRITANARESGDFIELDIRDNGSGIAEGDLQRIFEPFVSSRSSTHTGLGLFMTRRIVANLDGEIEAVACDTGARFIIRWPAAARQPLSAMPESGTGT